MEVIGGFLKGVFNFFVGDWIILGGVLTTALLVGLLENYQILPMVTGASGYILFAGFVLALTLTLYREVKP